MEADFPPYDASCTGAPAGSVETSFGLCDEGGVEIAWDYNPEYCERTPQGYIIYRTTTPPITGAESVCISPYGKVNKLEDRSSWEHYTYMLSGNSSSKALPVFTNKTPFGIDPNQASINNYRLPTPPSPPDYNDATREKECIVVEGSNRFNFSDQDFTIEMWIGNLETPWYYYFPCQTIASCYDASTNNRSWRIYMEPRNVTRAAAGIPGQVTTDMVSGNLIVEFYENGNGSGNVIREVVRGVGTNMNNWRQSPTGSTSRDGYMHLSVLRQGGVLKVYIDGVLHTSVPMPWSVAYNTTPIVFGRHYGNSGRLNPSMFINSVPSNDGDHSNFHGCFYDIRIVQGHAMIPPVGGQPADICQRPVWFDKYDRVDAIHGNIRKWRDPNPPTGSTVYYRVAAVNCDVEIAARCPSYIKTYIESPQTISTMWVDNPTDLATILASKPPTLLDIFNDWDRSVPVSRQYYPKGVGATGDSAGWYFDTTVNSFANPINTSDTVSIVSPSTYYQTKYIHEAVLKSNGRDDDMIGLVGAVRHDPVTNDTWSLAFIRTNGGVPPHLGWGVLVLGPGYSSYHSVLPSYDTCGISYGPVSPNNSGYSCSIPSSLRNGSDGWNGKTTSVMVVRDGNTITAHCSRFGSSGMTRRGQHRAEASWPDLGGVYDPASSITIDFNSTEPPAGLADWSMFRDQPTGVGFCAYSQGNAFYQDWFYDPPIGSQVFDFSNGSPGEVWEWSTITQSWYKTLDTAWEFVGQTDTTIVDTRTGNIAKFNCDSSLEL